MTTVARKAKTFETKDITQFQFRKPTQQDGQKIADLVADCPPLDINSIYCNFLQATHFSETCIVAEHGGEFAGFISAYLKPASPNVLFIWQVAVSPKYRGNQLAYSMLETLLSRQTMRDVHQVETTITQANAASWALFERLDQANGHRGRRQVFLESQQDFAGAHPTEYLFSIPLLPAE